MTRIFKNWEGYLCHFISSCQSILILRFLRLLALFSITLFSRYCDIQKSNFFQNKMVSWIRWDYLCFLSVRILSNSIEILSPIYTSYTITFLTERLLCEAFLKLVTVYFEFKSAISYCITIWYKNWDLTKTEFANKDNKSQYIWMFQLKSKNVFLF